MHDADPLNLTPAELERLAAYFAGELTRDEREHVTRWAEATPERARLVERLADAWDRLAPPTVSGHAIGTQVDAVLRQLWIGAVSREAAEIGGANGGVPRVTGLNPLTARRRSVWLGVAAAAAAVLVVGVSPWFLSRPGPESGDHATRTYATGIGQRATLRLADGSRVTLAPQTKLAVPRDPGTAERAMVLDGQAHFDVAPHADHPFVVRTGAVVTRVLGTAFDVRHYADDRDVRVAVEAGKVAVSVGRRRPVTLVAGMVARATDSTMSAARVPDVAPYASWMSGYLDFQEAPVPEVLATLSRWYGVRFQMADSTLPRRYVTAALDYSTTTDLVSAIETILNVSATTTRTTDGLVITLHPRKRAAGMEPARRALSAYTPEVGR